MQVTAVAQQADAISEDEVRAPHGRASEIRERLSSELIIGLIGPVASGVSTTAAMLKKKLEDDYGYNVPDIIKVSEFIRQNATKVGASLIEAPISDRINSYQDAGNKLREQFGSGILAKLSVRKISAVRHQDGFDTVVVAGEVDREIPVPHRRVHIVDSIKHPEEIAQLREIYGNIFWAIGVSAADHVRQRRLLAAGVEHGRVIELLRRDMGERAEFGQKVRKAFANADFFVRNDDENRDNIGRSLDRFLEVLFGTRLRNPTPEESAMFHAATAASKSACMSRQVGAAVVTSEGGLISVGWNDVPKYGGGLYGELEGQDDNRCFRWRDNVCHNDFEKGLIEDRVVQGIRAELVKKAANAPLVAGLKQVPVMLSEGEIRDAIAGSGIGSLIEFSRAIHAEMAAILSVARDKRHSLRDSTMVVTTYPCHNCARHIVAAGIKEVIYIEPYEKSLAIRLHPDSISEDQREANRVHFKQFQGFAPRHILELFSVKSDRKKDGKLVEVERKTAMPIYRRHLDSFTLYEDKVVNDVVDFV